MDTNEIKQRLKWFRARIVPPVLSLNGKFAIHAELSVEVDFGDKNYREAVYKQAELLVEMLERVGIERELLQESSEGEGEAAK